MKYDFIVIGGGIAGLNAAIRLSKYGKVLVATKEQLEDCNTLFAQGGIAASMGCDDSPELHLQDTLAAGDGLCNRQAVKVMVEEAPRRIRELIALGTVFDTSGTELALTREGAHSRNRILHAGGDATGKIIWQSLAAAAGRNRNITIQEHTFVTDLIVVEGTCRGIRVLDPVRREVEEVWCRAVLLAAGGAGRLYPVTTNPPTATGDGIAMAYRGGAELSDLEFIQFHPTALAVEQAAGFLISEAVRGEGGILRNRHGERFMMRYHPLAELAPRDVVARAIYREMIISGERSVYLDVTEFPGGFFARRFPQIHHQLCRIGIDVTRDLIPIAPAAHYMMGGVNTGLCGETSVSGLFAAGEVSHTGVHGANRLASNSLLEGLVFSSRAVELMAAVKNSPIPHLLPEEKEPHHPSYRYDQEAKNRMQKWVGIVRNGHDLKKAVAYFSRFSHLTVGKNPGFQDVEEANLGLVAYLCALSALRREESRGGHYREDFPEKNEKWIRHITIRKEEAGNTLCL
ncbi:L-aspartate oxidase [Candidatus Formimonas warabiya]|nr:L-aspartate oxidase [Candidatus Formimonas warabiya]